MHPQVAVVVAEVLQALDLRGITAREAAAEVPSPEAVLVEMVVQTLQAHRELRPAEVAVALTVVLFLFVSMRVAALARQVRFVSLTLWMNLTSVLLMTLQIRRLIPTTG
ncbi:MAG: hypothetical protein HLUCCX14_12610 [Marinobacter excellens HL-55]|uniref:Uncharacterized protein n=1 Tax=Marinobacter excellens HL-55 TaxID=1305731 RepID=A0A0P7ZF75_9GAMM|nr:MAG: hypothetical protein HLUCCX14_12610 [Marinobacter excellens HL-55]